MIDDGGTLGFGHKLTAVTDQTAGRNLELQTAVTAVYRRHIVQLCLADTGAFHQHTRIFIRQINRQKLDGLHQLSVNHLGDNLRTGYSKLKALAAHILNQNGQMQLAAAGNDIGIRRIRILRPED